MPLSGKLGMWDIVHVKIEGERNKCFQNNKYRLRSISTKFDLLGIKNELLFFKFKRNRGINKNGGENRGKQGVYIVNTMFKLNWS